MACERNFAGTTNQDLTLNNDHLVERVAILTMTWSYVRKDSSGEKLLCVNIIIFLVKYCYYKIYKQHKAIYVNDKDKG